MIVTFAVDPEALSEGGQEPGVRLGNHERLLRRWQRQGVLVYSGARLQDSQLMAAIRALPVDLRKRWQETFLIAWHRPDPGLVELAGVQQRRQLEALKGRVNLACLEATRAACVGLEGQEFARKLPEIDVEICRLAGVDVTEAFTGADRMSGSYVEAGSKVDRVWEERFLRLARQGKQVVVVDRYAAHGHTHDPKRSGLRRLLVNLDGVAGGVMVRLYSRVPDRQPVDAVEAALSLLLTSLSRGGVREFTLFLTPDDQFEHLGHDRYVRFESKLVSVGVGLEVLEGQVVRRRTTCTLLTHDEGTRRVEQELEEAAIFKRCWPLRSEPRNRR